MNDAKCDLKLYAQFRQRRSTYLCVSVSNSGGSGAHLQEVYRLVASAMDVVSRSTVKCEPASMCVTATQRTPRPEGIVLRVIDKLEGAGYTVTRVNRSGKRL